MFERFSEKTRRVIFFARFEAGQYGSRSIETEHILLALLREDRALMQKVLGPEHSENEIRVDIEKVTTKGKRISTSLEVPLSPECKDVLNTSIRVATKLGHRQVGPEHILLALMGADGSLATRMLVEKGVTRELIREKVTNVSSPYNIEGKAQNRDEANATLHRFLASLESNSWLDLALFFADNVQFIDSNGRKWQGHEEIEKQFETLFVPYAKRKVTCHLESADLGPVDCLVASLLWENLTIAGAPGRGIHRMTVMLSNEAEYWVIFFLQVTPIISG